MNLDHNTLLLLLTAAGVACIIILISWLRINAFLALLMAALLVGLGAGMSPATVAGAFQDGMGATLGGIAGVLGLGTMLGGLLAASGGAEVLAQSLVKVMGPKRVHWCLMVLALAVGFTTWFAVGLVMLVPILLTLTKETKMPFLKLALPLLAVLSIMHGVMPPHPGPLVAIDALQANLGMVIIWALIAAIPMAAVAGPIFASWAVKHVDITPPEPPPLDPSMASRPKPTLGRTIAALALPVVLILTQTMAELFTDNDKRAYEIVSIIDKSKANSENPIDKIAAVTSKGELKEGTAVQQIATVVGDTSLDKESQAAAINGIIDNSSLRRDKGIREVTAIIGNPTLALGIAVLFAAWAFGFARVEALKIGEKSLGPIGMTLLLVGAGGGFNRVLRECGAANAIGDLAASASMPPMLFGWVCAALIRVATGSATVAITAACGLVAPMALSTPGVNLELLVVCVGCGSLFLSHLNDAGFWIVKEMLGMTVSQTFRTWTVTETLIGITGLLVCWGLDTIF